MVDRAIAELEQTVRDLEGMAQVDSALLAECAVLYLAAKRINQRIDGLKVEKTGYELREGVHKFAGIPPEGF